MTDPAEIEPTSDERMTMAEWSAIRNAVSGKLRSVSSIGEKAAIDAAEAMLGAGWVSPTNVRAWLAAEEVLREERIAAAAEVEAVRMANRPRIDIAVPRGAGFPR
ncbi:hypothetical protein [Cryobacterium soli]|uniref:hypothetical protein n=1 Tax=Cryobacterium soli TaxID=2220095 RepID=UPI000E731040|nr:hypothetical protein [Cryobacterium soli]